jgi:hypothetical protein
MNYILVNDFGEEIVVKRKAGDMAIRIKKGGWGKLLTARIDRTWSLDLQIYATDGKFLKEHQYTYDETKSDVVLEDNFTVIRLK